MSKLFAPLLLIILCVNRSFALEPDFILSFSECSITVASSIQPDYPLKITSGDPSHSSCIRQAKKVKCTLFFKDGAKSVKGHNVHEYGIALEAGNILHLSLLPTSGDYITIDRNTHTAIIVTRIIGDNFSGAKVCRGIFLTNDEVKALDKK